MRLNMAIIVFLALAPMACDGPPDEPAARTDTADSAKDWVEIVITDAGGFIEGLPFPPDQVLEYISKKGATRVMIKASRRVSQANINRYMNELGPLRDQMVITIKLVIEEM